MTDNNLPVDESSDKAIPIKFWQRPWFRLAAAMIIILVIIISVSLPLRENGSSTNVDEADTLNFSEVVITNLEQEKEFNGTLGSIADDPVKTMLGGTITDIPKTGETISQGEMLFAVDNQPVVLLYGNLPAYRDIAIAKEIRTVSSQLSGTITWMPKPGTVIEQGDVLYRVDDEPVIALYGAQPVYRPILGSYEAEITTGQGTKASPFHTETIIGYLSGYDILQLEEALFALGYDPHNTLRVDTTSSEETTQVIFNWQRDVGATIDGIVHLGEMVFLPGPAQVLDILATPGDQSGGNIMTIVTGEPTSGADVLQLEEALIALGYDANGALDADGVYTPETTQAILDFQENTGLEIDGIINLGEIIFLPSEVRIKNQIASKGSNASAGSDILGISLSEKTVQVDLPADEQGTLSVGDAVTIEMPDNTEVPAFVIFISQTAISGQNEWDPATFEVRIAFDDPGVAAGLDEAPVDVIVVSNSVEDVLAVPVSALVALLEGGYAVEVLRENGQIELIAVEVGFFSTNNMIEITSGALEPGDQVVVP